MPNNKYWQDRFVMLQESQLKKGEQYARNLEEQYLKASMSMQKQIESWYQRFADNNEISLTESKVMLSGRELKEFKWDVHEYIKYGELNSIDQKWMKELENASARVHISRLEALKFQVQQQIEVLYGGQLDDVDKLMKNIYQDGYYHTAFEIQKGFNIGYDLHKLNSDQLQNVVSKPWTTDNRTFSDRIWGSKQDLIGQVHTGLTQAAIRGDSPAQTIKDLTNKMNVKRNQAGRLVMTESAFFSSAAQRDCFKSLDVEKFEVVATLDNRTSEICQDLDGHVFDMNDFEVGVTAPPFHVWCRSTTVPWFDDNAGERVARGDDGKTYFVPSDMKYEDWYKQHIVDKYGKDNADIMKKKALNSESDKKQHERYKSILGNEVPKSFDKFQELKYNNIDRWDVIKSNYRTTNYKNKIKEAYNEAATKEPKITNDLKRIVGKHNGELQGLEYRLKTEDSLVRKVFSDLLENTNIVDVINKTYDIVRYTSIIEGKNLVNHYYAVIGDLKNAGYSVIRAKNTWNQTINPYKGINVIVDSPDKQKFELQFHTQESFDVKNGEMHKLYEEYRLDTTDSKRRAELEKQMFDLANKLEKPSAISNIKNYDKTRGE
jgi:SPP1 gp7 family putative phage head morphogenesis protein